MPTPSNTQSSKSATIDRRTFVKGLSATGLGLAMGAAPVSTQPQSSAKRYCIVGLGSRSDLYQTGIEGAHKAHAQLVGICDTNPGRLEYSQSKSRKAGATPPPAFAPQDFEKMIAQTRPDAVIVTTVDSTHHDYITRAMKAGVDVITEKPMTNTAQRCQEILDTRAQTGRRCRVAFNYRYSPPRTQVKDILMSGAIGDILSVDFNWLLNTQHGADYFRRWHRRKEFSQGLMLHKSTHHFDLINWWLGAMPTHVFATGKREFYTPAMAKRLGLSGPHERCHTCPEKDKCTFFLDLAADAKLKALYLDNEKYDGYFRDQCVWSDQIDIEDTMNVLVRYDNNVTLAYSLNAFNAWEGYTVAFNGTKGRLEHTIVESIYADGFDGISERKDKVTTTIIPMRSPARPIEPLIGTGGHLGGDNVMLADLFLPDPPADKYLRAADERAGAASILVGIAANQCFDTGKGVQIKDLVTGLNRPEYSPMPPHTDPVPMPPVRKKAPAPPGAASS